MLKIVTLSKASLKMSEQELIDGLNVLKSTGAIASFKVSKGRVSLTLDHVRAELVLEHLVGIEPPDEKTRPTPKRGSNA